MDRSRSIEQPAGSAQALLLEPDRSVAVGRKGEILRAVADGLDALYALIVGSPSPRRGDGPLAYAMSHLATRSMTDLIASAHLASHAYLQQAYGTLRPVLENCDLIELFFREPDEAQRWIEAEEPGKLYRPSAVRKRIGASGEDAEAYGYISELGPHPRPAGSRIAGVMTAATDGEVEKLEMRIGPFVLDDPATVRVYMFIFQVLVRFAYKLRLLVSISEQYSDQKWSEALLTTVLAAGRGCKLIRAELIALGDDSDLSCLDTAFDGLISQAQAWRATDSRRASH